MRFDENWCLVCEHDSIKVFISAAQERRCRSKNCKHCIDYQPLTKLQMMLESEHVAVSYMHLTRWFASFESLLSLAIKIGVNYESIHRHPGFQRATGPDGCRMLEAQLLQHVAATRDYADYGHKSTGLEFTVAFWEVTSICRLDMIRLDRLSKWFWHVLTYFCEWQVLYCTPFFSHLRKSNPSIIVLSLPTMASSSSRSLKKVCLGLFAYGLWCLLLDDAR